MNAIDALMLMAAIGVLALAGTYVPKMIGRFSDKSAELEEYTVFMDSHINAGYGYAGAMAEWRVREEFARYRWDASEKVRKNPEAFAEILDAEAKAAAKRLKDEGSKDLIPAFAAMVGGLPYNHILYPEETAMVDALFQSPPVVRASMHRRAALRVVKPS